MCDFSADCLAYIGACDHLDMSDYEKPPCYRKPLTTDQAPRADVPLDRLVMPEMVLIPLDKYMADKADSHMRGAFIKDVKKIVEEDAPNWKERLSDWLELLA